MRRVHVKPYLFLGLFLLFTLSVSENFSETLRGYAVSTVSAVVKRKTKSSYEPDQLRLENERLKTQMETLKEWIISERRREEELNRLLWLREASVADSEQGTFFERRAQELTELIDKQLRAIPAKVIYREPIAWSSCIWLNVGQRDNEALGEILVAEDSPVVVGSALIGVVESVHRTKCRVRLITDAGLVLSVRAERGGEQKRVLAEQLMALQSTLEVQNELEGSNPKERQLLALIHEMHLEWAEVCQTTFLAKGELRGSSAPLWRARGNYLQGVGFNYDFPDAEGAACDLRTGAPLDGSGGAIPLLRGGDLLVTTGFDHIFPPGLHVARVVSIGRLREGASSYELTAKPIAPHLDHLETVFVLPPVQRKESL